MLRTIELGNEQIEYSLTYKNVKNLNLRIKSDNTITVSAPSYITEITVDEFVISKKNYILDCITEFRKLQEVEPREKRYVSGESFPYLGKNLQLKVVLQSKDEIYSDGRYLYLKIRDKDNYVRKQRIVEGWIKEQTIIIYNEIANRIYPSFAKYQVEFPTIRIRNMKKRWGSCQPKSSAITINSRLIEAPRHCIEYVMMHEFCHMIYPNHSKDFYLLLQVMMPDWKERKKKLEEMMCGY